MAECLIVARRDEGAIGRGLFAVLKRRPRTPIEAELAADAILDRAAAGSVPRLEDFGGSGEFALGEELLGAMLDCPLPEEGPWPVAGVADLELAQIAWRLEHGGGMPLPGRPSADPAPIPITPISAFADRGVVHRDIVEGEGNRPRGPFLVLPVEPGRVYSYPMLWGLRSPEQRRLVVEPDRRGAIKTARDREFQGAIDAGAERLLRTASRTHYNANLQFNANSLIVATTERPAIGGRAWPSVRLRDRRSESAFALWSNSTLGLLLHWWAANRTQSGRGTTTVSAIPRIPSLDVRALTDEQRERADGFFRDLAGERFLPFNQIAADEARARLDRAVLGGVLGLDEDLLGEGGPIDMLRRKLAAEPSIHGGKASRLAFVDGGERTA